MSRYRNYGMENNVTSELYAPLWVLATSVQVNQWQGQKRGTKFPILATIESFDAQGKCIKREWVKITAINGDVFTIERKFFSCLANDEANVQGRLSFDFVIGDKISLYIPKEIIERLNNAIDDLYDNGNERIKALPTGWLGIEVTAGNVRVGNQEFYFPWGQKVLNDNATNYVMLRGDSQIIIESERFHLYFDGVNQLNVLISLFLIFLFPFWRIRILRNKWILRAFFNWYHLDNFFNWISFFCFFPIFFCIFVA